MKKVVSCEWLQKNIDLPYLIILDASTINNKSGKLSTVTGLKIPNSRRIDIKSDFSDKESAFPNTLLSPESFEEASRNIGIFSNSLIVIYDNLGIYTSPRVWWMFKVMGFENISVLDGGLPEWVRLGYKTQPIELAPIFEKGNFISKFNNKLIQDYDSVLLNTRLNDQIVVDARAEGRFLGSTPEPRDGMMGGSIPSSCNLPYSQVLKDGKYLPLSELKEHFRVFVVENKPLIFSCGSGITACILYLAAELVSDIEKSVFDGSWTEWATRIQKA